MISEEKQRLRARMRQRTGAGQPVDCARAMARVLDGWPVWREASLVCAFAAIAGEPDVLDPWPCGKSIAIPRIDGPDLVPCLVDGPGSMEVGKFGVRVPSVSAVPAGHLFDVILVPGLAFDRAGRRLGRGAGYYDRFLQAARGLRVGVCFDDQLVDRVPTEDHDIAMDVVVTPSGVISCRP